MDVLVTGGAGFIGSHLVRALLARGDRVRVLDDLSTGRESRLTGLDVELIRGDVRSEADVARASRGVGAILHQAAQVSVPRSVEAAPETADINVVGTVVVLDAALREGARAVIASSCAVYGDSGRERQSESDAPAPGSPYAASKLATEGFLASAARTGLPAVALRYFNVYGEGQDPRSAYAAVVPAFAAALASGAQPTIFGDGEQSRDLVHVDDVVRANLAALEAPEGAWGRAFNVGTGRAVSVLELARRIGLVLGVAVEPQHAPGRAGDLRRSLADVELARLELGFVAGVELDDGLRRTLEPSSGMQA